MLVKGNTKLGTVWNWSIPAIESCPGSTDLCRSICYACRGAYKMYGVQSSYGKNWKLARSRHFVSAITTMINRKQIPVVRIHASGDFDTVSYVKKWEMIIRGCPDTQFYAYTRSWRRTGKTPPGLIVALKQLAKLPNLRLWLSCDRETGRPPAWPRCPKAWLMYDDQDVPQFPVELVFRNEPKTPMRHVEDGLQICPYEMHIPGLMSVVTRNPDGSKTSHYPVTCSKCKLCFDNGRKLLRGFDSNVELPPRRKRRAVGSRK